MKTIIQIVILQLIIFTFSACSFKGALEPKDLAKDIKYTNICKMPKLPIYKAPKRVKITYTKNGNKICMSSAMFNKLKHNNSVLRYNNNKYSTLNKKLNEYFEKGKSKWDWHLL